MMPKPRRNPSSLPHFSPADYDSKWVKYHSLEWGKLVEQGWITAYIGPGPRSKDALMVKPKAKKNPGRRRATPSRRSERGFFPSRRSRALSRNEKMRQKNRTKYTTLKRIKKTRFLTGYRMSPRRNPATYIKRSKKLSSYQADVIRYGARHRRRLKVPTSGPFAVQVKRGKLWITLASFPFKASATDYGRALKTRYPGKSFRVFW